MTLKPLVHDFPMASDMAQRPPRLVGTDELLLDLEEERQRRLEVYPAMVKRGTLTEDEARRHNAVWRAMIDDHCRAENACAPLLGRTAPHADVAPYALDWDARIRELRRELAMRRNAYPKWAASATNPLAAAEAIKRLERLDAVHHRYWAQLWCFSALPAIDDHARHAWAAKLERCRRQAAWSAGKASADGKASAAAFHEERAWRAIETFARIRAGENVELAPPAGDTIDAMLAIADARVGALLRQPAAADPDDIIAQLAPLTRWLAREAPGRATIKEERMAA